MTHKTSFAALISATLLTGCSYLYGSNFTDKKVESLNSNIVRTETDKRDIQIEYVKSQGQEVRYLINSQKWLSDNAKQKVGSDINLVLKDVNSVSKTYHSVCDSNNQPYYESFNYFIDMYLGSIMRTEDSATKALNQTIVNKAQIKKDSKCRNEKSCNLAMSNYFINAYNDNSVVQISDVEKNLNLIKSLENYQNNK